MAEEGPWTRLARGFALASTLGLGFALSAGLGLFLGYLCDRALGLRFLACTVVLGLAGGGAGLLFVVRSIAALDRSERRRPPDDSGSMDAS